MSITSVRALAAGAVALICLAFAAPTAAVADPAVAPGIARVSAAFPLTTPESRTALLSATTLASYTSPTGVLTTELETVINTPVAIGIDPMILASIRVLGSAAPPSAAAWLDRLARASNQTFALTWADSDITVALQAGATAVVAPTSFDFAVDASHFTPATTATPTPSPTAAPGALQPLPTTESLLEWNYTIQNVAWPVAGTVTSPDLAKITASGYTSTILDSANLQRTEAAQAHASVNGASVVVTDAALSALFDTAINSQTSVDLGANLVPLQSAIDATAATGGAGGATILLTVDRNSLGDASNLAATVIAIDALASSQVVQFSSTLGGIAPPATLVELPQTAARVASAASLLATETSDAAFATVAKNPLLITGERRLRLLATLSTAWTSYPSGWGSAVELFGTESQNLHNAVRIVKSSDINLVADRSFLPVTVSNSLTQPVTVYITVTAPTPLLEIEQRSVEVTIEPDSQRRGQIPVQSLSNGTAQIAVTIASAASVPIGTATSVRINVYAGWETPITVTLGVIVFLIFAFGIARTIRKRRRPKPEPAE